MTDPWAHWRANLAGEKVQFSEGTPHAGFYRAVSRDGYGGKKMFTPVAYWPIVHGVDGELACRMGRLDVTPERGRDIWTYVCNHPVSEEAYRAVAERGESWPDEHELVGMGDNNPPDDNSFEGLQTVIEDLSREAKQRLEGPPVEDQDEADRLANLADRLAELWKKADEARKVEKRPHDEAAAEVQKKWAPLLVAAETYRNLKYKLLTPWLKKVQEAAKFAAEVAAAEGVQGPSPEDTPRPRAGTRGRAMSLKTTRRAEITDYEVCLNYFRDNSDIKATVQDLANKAVRAGVTVPGAKLIEEQGAV